MPSWCALCARGSVTAVSEDEAMRRSCYEGLRAIPQFVVDNGFVELVACRNRMAKALGYEDYYDCEYFLSEEASRRGRMSVNSKNEAIILKSSRLLQSRCLFEVPSLTTLPVPPLLSPLCPCPFQTK